ncbi:MAG: alpha-2-macroglobulin [Syntrophobacteraceae bacterium]
MLERIRLNVSGYLSFRNTLVGMLLLVFLSTINLLAAADAAADEKGAGGILKITRITPSGVDVPAGRQIVFEFNRPVVPLGKMERSASEIPIEIEPALTCQWRWLNPSNLACRLDEKHAMVPSTSYSIKVKPEIRSEDGAILAEPVVHSFVTVRPKITSSYFKKWLSPGMPQFRVRFDQAVGKDSLEAHVFFRPEKGQKVTAKVVEDPDYSKEKPGLVWNLSPAIDLPPDNSGQLVVEPGIVPLLGKEAGVENRNVLGFQTLPEFRFHGVQCKDLKGKELIFSSDKPAAAQARCNPSSEISLLFSAPIVQSELRQKVTIGRKGERKGDDVWSEDGDYSRLSEERKKGQYYSYTLQDESIKPFSQYYVQAKANSLKDEFGRVLSKSIGMGFATDHMPPGLRLYKNMSALEKGLDTDLPVIATNMDQIAIEYETLTSEGRYPARKVTIPGPRVRDVTKVMPLGVRKLIGSDSGVIAGNFSTSPAVRATEDQPRWFFAQVTPFHVHVKLGHFNTVVWVTDLQSGEPVPGVEVRIQKDTIKEVGLNPEVLAQSLSDSNGMAELPGTARIDPALKFAEGYKPKPPWLFVWCRKGGDVALVPLRYDFRVDSEGSNHQYIPADVKSLHGHMRAWGATAQGIYRVGDTVQYKIYVRDQENRRFVQPPPGTFKLKVFDPTSREIYRRDDIKLSQFGALDGEFQVPKNGAVGLYRFQLGADFTKLELEPMQVLVSDFTPSPFRVTAELNGSLFGAGDPVKVATQARLHAGGPYGRADLRLTASVEPLDFRPDNPLAREFQFDVRDKDEDESPGVQSVFETRDKLDNNGNHEAQFEIKDLPVSYGRLTVESSVKDERGKSVAGRTTATYFGRDRYVGLFQSDWLLQEGKPAKTSFVVVDQHGKTAPGVETRIEVERLQIKAARVKEAGDAYPAQYVKEWVPVEKFTLSSGDQPQPFEFIPKESGTVRISATVADSKGRDHRSSMRRWISGKSHVLWETSEGNLLNIYPEKEEYRVGDTARFFVQNPYPGAKAFITVERYGTLGRWVKKMEHSSEIVEIPVLPDYLPGFYLSVMIMSPRVEKPLGPGGEDLGKPAFRMGYAKIEVKDQYKEIEVKCVADKEVYKPRDRVKLEFEAHPKNAIPNEKNPPIELAVAVLDESVFDLLRQKRQAFDPYQGFYHLDGLDLINYNLIMQLVGREKLEKKGASPAAGAGFDMSMRSVFKYVSYWNPSLRVDDDGKAIAEFFLPDNLTGWRVLAMAVTPDDRMGLGESTFKVNQLTEIRPVLPNQVMEGDSFSAGFSVMNRTGETRNIEVQVTAEGQALPPESGAAGSGVAVTRTVSAEPYKRDTVRLPMKASGPGEIVFTVKAGDTLDKDGMRHVLKVIARRSGTVAAAYGMVDKKEVSQIVAFPENMRPEHSLLSVALSPSILGGLDGSFAFMRDYPYECWEQKLSRAVMAAAFPHLVQYFPGRVSWENSAAEAKKILAMAAEFQAPNGGMAFYLPRDEFVSPFLSAYTAQAFNWFRDLGHAPPPGVEEKLLGYLKNLLKQDQSRDNLSRNMIPNIRALALAALSHKGMISRADLERHRTHFPQMDLFGKAAFLEALCKVPDTQAMQAEALKAILAHSDSSSGSIRFTAPSDSASRFTLASTLRDNAAILMAFLALKQKGASSELGDIPVRLMHTIATSRKGKDHWASTQENVFAVLAALRFSKTYENVKPEMSFQALLDQQLLGDGKFHAASDPPVKFDYKVQESDRGRKASVAVKKEGAGSLYQQTILSYAPAEFDQSEVNAGIEMHREYSVERDGKWVLLQSPMQIKTGELMRVDIFVSLPAERYFVVVDDPVPGGLEPVSKDLATSSEIDARKVEATIPQDSFKNRFTDWRSFGISRWSFYHKELRHSAARFYSERLNPGNYHLSYTAQAIAPGRFTVLPARAEEMYDPDVFGKSSPAVLKVDLAE